MIASVEKNKLVYVLNRNAQAELTISSPLEAHKAQALVFSLTGLDAGYDNPLWAALEIDYGDSDEDPTGQAYQSIEKQLVFYELDLGLNHVLRKWSDTVDRSANLLLYVPGGTDGPGGVLVCAEDNVTYRHSNQEAHRIPIPRRSGATEDPNRKRHIVCGAVHRMRKQEYFFLLQTEDGDLFKVSIDMVQDEHGRLTGEVQQVVIKYFDTVPVATSLIILRSGFLFVVGESGDHHLYEFESLAVNDDETEFASQSYSAELDEAMDPAYFHPRPLKNLDLKDPYEVMNPLLGSRVSNLTDEDAPQIYSICGTGPRSSFKTTQSGLQAREEIQSALPSVPTGVWTAKLNKSDVHDTYIVFSFSNMTLVLSIISREVPLDGEENKPEDEQQTTKNLYIEEASDTGFLTSAPTLAVQLLGEDALIQVHPKGMRHILRGGRIREWQAPQHRTVVAATSNERQLALGLSSGEIVYFELDDDGALAEFDDKREMSGTVTCLSLGEVPEGRVRSSFLAVGCDDLTVRILSLDPDSTLENKSVQALTAAPSALKIMSMADSFTGGNSLFLHIGLQSGVYLRTLIDDVTGDLGDTRTRFLGPRPVNLFQVTVMGQSAVMALSSRPWLAYSDTQNKSFMLRPVLFPALECCASHSNVKYGESVIGIYGQNMR